MRACQAAHHRLERTCRCFRTGTIRSRNDVDRAQGRDLSRTGQSVSVAGGGDTVAALNQAGVAEQMTYVSTAGGAFLEWMEGKELLASRP